MGSGLGTAAVTGCKDSAALSWGKPAKKCIVGEREPLSPPAPAPSISPKHHTHTHTHKPENPLRRQRVRVKKYKKAQVHQSPERALNWEFQVENGYHFTTLDLLASEWTTLSSLGKC